MLKSKIYIILAALSMLTACSDDHSFPAIKGNLETVDGLRVTIFHLLADKAAGWEACDDVKFLLVDPASQTSLEFPGTILHSTESGKTVFTCRLRIGDTEIPDGTYFVTLEGENLPDLGVRTVRFSGNIGTEEESFPMDYADLEGEGTEAAPYLISSQGDFLIFLSYLTQDPSHAYGRYFLQTRSFELPHRSQVIDGKVWAAVSFSGNYDGDGHKLFNLVYQGASDPSADSGIGLFRELYAATVRNLTISGALISNSCSNVGIIAGSAAGGCAIENVSVEGTLIANGSNLGGILGYSRDDLVLKNVTLNSLTISGSEASSQCVGSLIGCHEKGNLHIEGVNTPDHVFSAVGAENVGGLVGKVSAPGKSVSVSGAILQHSVDTESSGVKIIKGSANVGGLIGSISGATLLSLSGNQVKAPVSGEGSTGGLVGSCEGLSEATVEACMLTSIVSGDESVGGFFGYLNLISNGALNFNGVDNGSRIVLKSSAAAEVMGKNMVGALVGNLSGNDGMVTFNSKVEIAVNVNAEDCVGGAFGYLQRVSIVNADRLNFSSSTMKVEATGRRSGGIVGVAHKADISGSLSLDPVKEIPDKERVASTFNGVVIAPQEAGGIVGELEGGSVKGLASAASVTSQTEVAGGIVGKASDATVSECAFLGNASCPQKLGGILGYTFESTVKVTKCVNYADLSDATRTGGIMAHYENLAPTHADVVYSARYLFIGECVNMGRISNGLDAGGIIACADHSDYGLVEDYKSEKVRIENCGNFADVRGKDNSGKYSVGGVAGTLNCNNVGVRHCANLGKISSSGVQKTIGGVVGHSGNKDGGVISVEECMNNGEVTCDASSTKLGGVVGHQETYLVGYTSKVENCLNWGSLPGKQKDDSGGILGYAASHSSINYCVNRGIVAHGNAIVGTHNSGTKFYHTDNYYFDGSGAGWPSAIKVTPEGLISSDPFKNLDFKHVWILVKDQGPMLRNCPFQPKV